MLYVQWRAVRWPLVPLVLLAMGLPLLMLGGVRRYALEGEKLSSELLLAVQGSVLGVFPALAVLSGFVVALAAWHWDHRLGHGYALSLPVGRARYVLLRLLSGAVLLAVPVAALWAGAITAVATTPIPDGLRAYPVAFGLRFLLACVIAYVVSFALAAGTMRTVLVVAVSLVAFLVLGTVAVDAIEGATHLTGLFRPIDLLQHALVRWPGPFHVFGGSWMLIDA